LIILKDEHESDKSTISNARKVEQCYFEIESKFFFTILSKVFMGMNYWKSITIEWLEEVLKTNPDLYYESPNTHHYPTFYLPRLRIVD
jgi:hypothetical protein